MYICPFICPFIISFFLKLPVGQSQQTFAGSHAVGRHFATSAIIFLQPPSLFTGVEGGVIDIATRVVTHNPNSSEWWLFSRSLTLLWIVFLYLVLFASNPSWVIHVLSCFLSCLINALVLVARSPKYNYYLTIWLYGRTDNMYMQVQSSILMSKESLES